MNKTTIEYCHNTLNPITGCWGPGGTEKQPRRCWYCYAHKLAGKRLRGRAGYPADGDPFRPTFHPERLRKLTHRQKPRTIFMGSMCDMWGPWVPLRWQADIIHRVKDAHQHRYLFLSKSPQAYDGLHAERKDDWWLGVTVTGEHPVEEVARLRGLTERRGAHNWVSIEPLLKALVPDLVEAIVEVADWAVVGPLTGASVDSFCPARARWLIRKLQSAGIPVFVKDASRSRWYRHAVMPQELPWFAERTT